MILEENRANLMFEHRELVINIVHDFYGDEHYQEPYVKIVDLVSCIVMLYEELGVTTKSGLRFNTITPLIHKMNEPIP